MITYELALFDNSSINISGLFSTIGKVKYHMTNLIGLKNNSCNYSYIYKERKFKFQLYNDMDLLTEAGRKSHEYICFCNPNAVVIVADIDRLGESLNLAFLILDYNQSILLFINTSDLKNFSNTSINKDGLFNDIGIPIELIDMTKYNKTYNFKQSIDKLVNNKLTISPININYDKLNEKQTILKSKLQFSKNKDYLSKRILDSDDHFFNTYYKYYPDERVNIEILRDLMTTKENREYISQTNFKIIKKTINKNVINN